MTDDDRIQLAYLIPHDEQELQAIGVLFIFDNVAASIAIPVVPRDPESNEPGMLYDPCVEYFLVRKVGV